jgi:hypothetical protein
VNTIVVEVSGGVVQEIYSDASDLRVTLVDWDAGERPGDAFAGGMMPVQPVDQMPTETRIAFAHLRAELAANIY